MITEAAGNLLTARVEALVNTVNTEGVMGKGIALQFKKAFPAMFRDYAASAKRGSVQLGQMHVWPTQALDGPKYIINFPTKARWRSRSRIEDIESGLTDLVKVLQDLGIASVAVPPLGCGNGGLDWAEVEPLIRASLAALPHVDVRLYPPAGAPSPAEMVVSPAAPKMTPGRAALVGMVTRYSDQAFSTPSLIETQKLMYFLQAVGEPLKLTFGAHRYGPYADNLRHVLAQIEGHFITGFGDGSAKVADAAPLSPISEALPLAEHELDSHPETRERMERVLALAAGFETAYGMELLATVHWVATYEAAGQSDQAVAARVAQWSPRKAIMFTTEHVEAALGRLREHHLLNAA